MTTPNRGRRLLTPALAAVALIATGCAHVSQDDLNDQLATVRADLSQEIREGDQSVRTDLGGRISNVEQRVDALQADLRALQEEFDVRVQELEAALRFDVPVYFGFDDATIAAQGRTVLDRFGDILDKYYGEAQITVEGFTDPAGSAAYNQRLGQRRADAVKTYLVDGGIPGDRVRAVSYGEDTSRLIARDAQGPGTEGWENRRVVIVIDHTGTASAAVASREEGQR